MRYGKWVGVIWRNSNSCSQNGAMVSCGKVICLMAPPIHLGVWQCYGKNTTFFSFHLYLTFISHGTLIVLSQILSLRDLSQTVGTSKGNSLCAVVVYSLQVASVNLTDLAPPKEQHPGTMRVSLVYNCSVVVDISV